MAETIDVRDLEINALLEVTQAINNNLSEDDLYKIYRFTLLADLKVKKLAMFVEDQNWHCRVFFGTDENWSSQPIPHEYLQLKEITKVNEESDFQEFTRVFPVLHKQKLLAVVFIGEYGERIDVTFLMALTNILIVAIENKKLARKQLEQEAYRKELEIAKKVQNFLFPKQLPKSPRLKIDAVYLPHQDIGGDYYDYLPLGNDRFMICIADVSGKGVPAALLMSNFQAALRTLVRKTQDLLEVIAELNHATYSSSDGDNFITFFLGMYDYKAGSFQYVNCGHNPSILIHEGKTLLLEEGTTVLGMFDPLPFLESKTIENISEFLFFAYTDGLVEAFNREEEQFGLERLMEIIGSHTNENLSVLHQFIFKALDDFRQDSAYHDDITMISCQVNNMEE